MNTLEPRQDFDDLTESYVIFITRDDVLGFGLPIYHVSRFLEENGERFQDGSHIIYVNSKRQDDTELGRLMHDFHCKNAEEMYNSILAERVRELKETSEGVDYMCAAMDQIYQEGMEVGIVKAKKETVISLAAMGFSADKIAQVVKLQIQLVQEWITEGLSLAK